MVYIFLIIAFLLNAFASIFLKLQSLHGFYIKPDASFRIITQNSWFILALAFFGLNVIFYTLALSRIPLSIANLTMVIMSFLIVTTFSALYFKESINIYQLIGFGLIISGLIMVVGMAGKVS